MTTHDIVQKLWNLCNVLRDDGITYHQYVTELTYILFLKMAKETGAEKNIPEKYRWDELTKRDGVELKKFYNELLQKLGEEGTGRIKEIYAGAASNIDEPANLKKIITTIDGLDWFSAKEEGLGNLYEGLLEKNANEKKSGAGQYFTPRVLIDVMTRLIAPQPGERCNDPACGTFGFMIAASQYVREHTDNFYDLDEDTAKFEREEAFTGCELVHDTHRLALMNAMLHDIDGEIKLGDTLSDLGKSMKGYDVVLTNPPFGTKKGGERATRDDFTYPTSNKQLNFLQHIYRSLKADGKARAAVIIPDIPSETTILGDLMDKCNLHTVLRLPNGIFYAQNVKTNVLFFTRGVTDKNNTKDIWFYDLRTNMRNFGKSHPIQKEDFDGFVAAYQAKDRSTVKDERWSLWTREEVEARGNIFDCGLIQEDSALDYLHLPDPVECGEQSLQKINTTAQMIENIINILRNYRDEDDFTSEWRKAHNISKSDWKEVKLGDVCEINPKKINTTDLLDDMDVTFIPMASVDDATGKIVDYQVRKLGKVKNGFTNFQEGDVVFAKITPCMENGKTAVVGKLTNNIGYGTTEFYVLRCKKELNNHYLYHMLRSRTFRDQAKAVMTGSVGQQRVPKSFLENYILQLPPVSEQMEIVNMLDYFSGLETKAEETIKIATDNVEIIRQAILSKAYRDIFDSNS